jgi:hypothetical protein
VGQPGRWIIRSSWLGNALFAVTAVPVALGVDALDTPSVVVDLALFFVSLLIWGWALGAALARTTRGDDVQVTTLFLMEGRVPGAARWPLYGALAVCLAITVGTAAANPFGVLVPMYPLGLIGLWGAKHGVYPERRTGPRR